MAKVIAPLMSASARGKVGGIIFNVWRGISTVKIFKSPANPQSERQLAMRAILKTLSQAWAALTDGQRTGWNDWADAHPVSDWTGTPIRMTGENAFIKCNSLRLDQGSAQVATAPTASAPASVAGLVLTPGSGQISVAHTSPGGTATAIDIWLDGPLSAGRQPDLTRATHQSYSPAETSPTVVSGLTAGIYDLYARHVSETDGQASGFVTDRCTVS